MTEEQDPIKREFEKLLREYAANSGMAGFVCGRPVELMPESEQSRIINGFCTKENLKILSQSRKKLEGAADLDITEAQANRAKKAVVVLDDLVEVFTSYTNSEFDLAGLREKVRAILHKPIPDSKDELIEEVSKLIEMVTFLGDQDLKGKDSWDRMLDCVQMHDVLSRTKDVCTALQAFISKESEVASQSEALEKSIEISTSSIEFLEAFFRGETAPELLQNHFQQLSKDLSDLWI